MRTAEVELPGYLISCRLFGLLFLCFSSANFNVSVGSNNCLDKPDALFILAEKEVVVIDLKSEDWQECRLPYLRAVNGSAIQTLHLEENVPVTLWEQIASAGDPAGDFSARVSFTKTHFLALRN